MSEDLIERLRELSASRKPHYGGAHGQIVGMESYRIIANGFALECVDEAADRIVTLEQQLATREAQIVMLRKQVSADVAQILKLLDVIDSVRGPTGATEGIQEHAQHIEKVALAATDDLGGLILCEKEPVAEVKKHTGSLKDMAIIVWSGEQPAEGTQLYRAWEPKP